jgi:hypothetical protein
LDAAGSGRVGTIPSRRFPVWVRHCQDWSRHFPDRGNHSATPSSRSAICRRHFLIWGNAAVGWQTRFEVKTTGPTTNKTFPSYGEIISSTRETPPSYRKTTSLGNQTVPMVRKTFGPHFKTRRPHRPFPAYCSDLFILIFTISYANSLARVMLSCFRSLKQTKNINQK